MYWTVPREWEGQTAILWGGGPSVKPEQVALAKERGWRRLAINDAGLVLDPEADAMCWGDSTWFQWNAKELGLYKGPYRVTWRAMPDGLTSLPFHTLRHPPMPPALSFDQVSIRCNNSGHGALNLAISFGAKRILLIGFEMKPVGGKAHWHRRHQVSCGPSQYVDHYAPAMAKAAKQLEGTGIEVINCTPDTFLKCFPKGKLEDIR